MQKLAIFDIDKTIIRSDSMFQFVMYGIKRKPWTAANLLAICGKTALYKLRLMEVERVKAAYFYAIRYFSEQDLEHFYDTVLVPSMYEVALEEMKRCKDEGCHVLLVTASPHAYTKYFKKLPYVDEVIGTALVCKNGRYNNQIEGNNCKGEEKVARIKQYLQAAGYEIDYKRSAAYSDSLSDMPMFRLVQNRYLINKISSHPELEGLKWNH
ncbi:HAD family hydrolase [Paenibacillus sp. GCM10027626]|uniref:HAD family hydrolase n=1 Tax=Paenibacillus sp. GCM10027626 TaxID=3273411 RepID=UPI00363A2734